MWSRMTTPDDVIQAVRPRWYLYPAIVAGEDPVYDADAEYCDMEAAADELAEAYIAHNNHRIKCNNLAKPKERQCQICYNFTGDYYHVWKLLLRMQRFGE